MVCRRAGYRHSLRVMGSLPTLRNSRPVFFRRATALLVHRVIRKHTRSSIIHRVEQTSDDARERSRVFSSISMELRSRRQPQLLHENACLIFYCLQQNQSSLAVRKLSFEYTGQPPKRAFVNDDLIPFAKDG